MQASVVCARVIECLRRGIRFALFSIIRKNVVRDNAVTA